MIDYPNLDIHSLFLERTCGVLSRDIQNIKSAYLHATNKPFKNLDINNIASHVLYGDAPKQITSTRTDFLFHTKATTNYHQYNPTAPQNIRSALLDIERYIELSHDDILIKAAMCYYQFQMISPYDSENGIIGRILPYHMLSSVKLNGIRFLSLSVSLFRRKAECLDKLWSAQRNGNYAAWIEFFVNAIKDAAQKGIEFVQFYCGLPQSEEEVILRTQGRRDNTPDIYRYFKRNIVSSIGFASKDMGLSFRTVSRSVVILQEQRILSQITEGTRNRLFAHAGSISRLTSPE